MNETFMKERPVLPLILSMSLPMVISMLVNSLYTVSYTHLRAHETGRNLVCRLLLEKKKRNHYTAADVIV